MIQIKYLITYILGLCFFFKRIPFFWRQLYLKLLRLTLGHLFMACLGGFCLNLKLPLVQAFSHNLNLFFAENINPLISYPPPERTSIVFLGSTKMFLFLYRFLFWVESIYISSSMIPSSCNSNHVKI